MVDFEKILNKNINHSMILDRDGVLKAMVECYNLGIKHSTINYSTDNKSSETETIEKSELVKSNI